MRYWLMKSEPDEVSVDDVLAMPGGKVAWYGVRNFQARNFMKDQMRPKDGVLFYHSSCPEPGIVGIAEVASPAYPDAHQFDAQSRYHDPTALHESPRWYNVDVKVLRKTRLMGLPELRSHPELASMVTLRRGNRLSITPVTRAEWDFIVEKLEA
jgi:predicted RNA-binding protein with PUA-like domain